MKPKMIGTINCYITSKAIVNGKEFHYNGTTKNLVEKAIEFGAKANDIVETFDCTTDKAPNIKYKLYNVPIDKRVLDSNGIGIWAERLF